LAFVRGLALVLDVPVIGITTFEALAASARGTMPDADCWVIQDARRGEVYVQGFGSDGKPLGEAQVLDHDAASIHLASASGLATGSGIELVTLPPAITATSLPAIPDIEQVARLAADAEPGDTPPSPFYLRAPDAKAQAPLVKHAAAEITIEQAGADHAAILATLHAASFEQGWSAAQFAELVNAPGSLCLLALTPGTGQTGLPQPCGFVLARKAADEMEIITIAVQPATRRQRLKVFIKTYGCQMNVYDSDRMADALAPAGYTPTQDHCSRCRPDPAQHLPYPREGCRKGLFRAWPRCAKSRMNALLRQARR
jgi:hypothetical protein